METINGKELLMNPFTGSVDTAENWKAEGWDIGNSVLVPVKWNKEDQQWEEVK